MARSFRSADLSRVIDEHRRIQIQLKDAADLAERYKRQIRNAVDIAKNESAYEILNGIPIEELNRDKRGIKTKILRDCGFETVGDIAKKNEKQIEAINGIGPDTAHEIREVVNEFLEEAGKNNHVRLSYDHQTGAAGPLVASLYIYNHTKDYSEQCKKLIRDTDQAIRRAMDDLKIVDNTFKWMFSSQATKQRAEDAYTYLDTLLKGTYGKTAREATREVKKYQTTRMREVWEDFKQDSITYNTSLEDVVPGALGEETSAEYYGLSDDLVKEIQAQEILAEGLYCTLRRYQEWGVKYILHQKKVLLGDEMGLGKTVQAIAAMVSLRNSGSTHFLVICPASVIANWCREIEKHSNLSAIRVHGADRKTAYAEWKEKGGVAVTTYETTAYLGGEEAYAYDFLVVDEAHYVKNPEAKRTQNVRKLGEQAQGLLYMTGTALENKVEEMLSLIQVLRPDVASQVKSLAFMSSAPQFREKIAPVYYRRRREDVLTELPEKTETKEWCTLTAEEEKIYEQTLLSKNYANIRRVSWNVDDPKNSSKAKRLLEIVAEAKEEDRKVIVFSFFLDTIAKVSSLFEGQCTQAINGSVSPQRRQEIIDEFDKAPAGTVLPAQIQSGGTGLNIQTASVVIICEPQFKPSIENQAIARAYRMGQARNVLVYRLLAEDTVDERIMQMLTEKQTIFDAFADESVVGEESLELDEKSFGQIVDEEIARIQEKNGESGAEPDSEVTIDESDDMEMD